MTTGSTRRSFISVAGAALSAPLVVAGASLPGAAVEGESLQVRLARLEDEKAIRALNELFAKHVSADARDDLAALFDDPSHARIEAGVCGLTTDTSVPADVIDIAADRRSAVARVHWTAHTETIIGPDCTVVEMARLQGGGVLHAAERPYSRTVTSGARMARGGFAPPRESPARFPNWCRTSGHRGAGVVIL